MGLVIFLRDWSGYDTWKPRLFSPRPIREVWWHLPAAVAIGFGSCPDGAFAGLDERASMALLDRLVVVIVIVALGL